MHRHVFGVIGLIVLLFGAALVAYNYYMVEAEQAQTVIIGAGLIRAGILTLALWLAMPERADQIPWGRVGAILVAGILIMALWPRALLVLVPVALVAGFVGYVLRPRPKGSARYRPRPRR